MLKFTLTSQDRFKRRLNDTKSPKMKWSNQVILQKRLERNLENCETI